MLDARITGEPLDPVAEGERFLARSRDCGAVVTFVGLTRPAARHGSAVQRLFLDHHRKLTAQSVREIAAAALNRFEVDAVTAVHRYGEVRPGEAIVFVAAAGAHRRAAFEATDYLMDRLKTEAMFWKREDTASGSQWIEPTDADQAERARWSDRCED